MKHSSHEMAWIWCAHLFYFVCLSLCFDLTFLFMQWIRWKSSNSLHKQQCIYVLFELNVARQQNSRNSMWTSERARMKKKKTANILKERRKGKKSHIFLWFLSRAACIRYELQSNIDASTLKNVANEMNSTGWILRQSLLWNSNWSVS